MSETVVDGPGLGRGGRMSAGRKRAAVLRLLRGEDLGLVSRELGVTAARLSQWRGPFFGPNQAAVKSRPPARREEGPARPQDQGRGLSRAPRPLGATIEHLSGGGPLARPRG